ncbi:hypothetical protein GF367_00905 [Candidatus Woesearchaeota archaeon]|nr:hypothetical protein [Candidatus Woesearchaeota archaeon]
MEDVHFIKDYVAFTSKQQVQFDPKLEPLITNFFAELKEREDDHLIELSPRLVLGVVRMAKALARMQLKSKVTKEDLEQVLQAFQQSLIIAPDNVAKKRYRSH